MRYERMLFFLFLLLLFLQACGSAQETLPTNISVSSPAQTRDADLPARQPWEINWEKIKAAAKKEGRVLVYSSITSDVLHNEAVKIMKEKYGLSLEMMAGRSGQVSEKFMTERRAGLYLVDIVIGGQTSLLPLKDAGTLEPLKALLILPELTDPEMIKKTWRNGELHWKDKERSYVLGMTNRVSPGLAYNTNLVQPEELQSYQDLLNPKWKGKIIMYDPFTSGSGQNAILLQIHYKRLDWDYYAKLARQEPLILVDRRMMAEWVAKGKYAILLGSPSENVQSFIDAGAPIKWGRLKDPTYTTSGSANLSFVNRSPHPNAAAVFINWLLSKEGADLLVRARGTPSARLDATLEGVPKDQIPEPDVQYLSGDAEELLGILLDIQRKIKEIFGPLVK